MQQVKNYLVTLYKNGLNPLLTTFGGDVYKKSGWVFSFMFKINIVGQQGFIYINSENIKCEHPNSDAFMVFQDFTTSKTVLNDLKNLTQFSHTETLEIYHTVYNS